MKTFAGARILFLTALLCFPVITFVGCNGAPPEAIPTAPEDDPTLSGEDGTTKAPKADADLDPTLGGGA
jgi:hypothetical protein